MTIVQLWCLEYNSGSQPFDSNAKTIIFNNFSTPWLRTTGLEGQMWTLRLVTLRLSEAHPSKKCHVLWLFGWNSVVLWLVKRFKRVSEISRLLP